MVPPTESAIVFLTMSLVERDQRNIEPIGSGDTDEGHLAECVHLREKHSLRSCRPLLGTRQTVGLVLRPGPSGFFAEQCSHFQWCWLLAALPERLQRKAQATAGQHVHEERVVHRQPAIKAVRIPASGSTPG